MQLQEGERILQVYHHHPTPFVFNVLKAFAASLPFFVILFLFKGTLSTWWFIVANVILLFAFVLLITYLALIFWLDRLVITNLRVVLIDWKYLTIRDEAEALLEDIEDIKTEEKGFLAFFRALDYGKLKLATASSRLTLIFDDAPNPESIRRFIYHVRHQ